MLQIIANIRSRYRWALLAIAILSTAAALLMQYLFAIQKDESLVINIAGKQRMLSQKIAWYSNIINDSHKLQQHPKYKEALENAVTEFQQGHQFLTKQDQQGHYLYLNTELEDHYFSMPDMLAIQSEQYILTAQQILKQSESNIANLHIFSLDEAELLLTKLDDAVTLFEQQTTHKVALISYLELSFWLLTLLLLMIELKFIFQPMERQIIATLNKYQQQKKYAEQISQNKERFIARTSHEFRTPLQGLMHAIDELEVNTAQQAVKQQAQYCANRLINMLDELHEAQLINKGLWQLKLSRANILDSLQSVVNSYQFACTQKQLALFINLSPELDCDVELDHPRLQQLVGELLSNAIKFTDKGNITVSASIHKMQQLHLTVSDTGTGFLGDSPEFFLQNETQQNHFQGLQMGLSRVQNIVSAQQGDIEFLSNKPYGAKVHVVLPVKVANAGDETQLPVNLHCLVVEDNPLNAMILGRILAELNYTYDMAENGLIATDKVTESQYDLIFMDLNMPVMDGFQAIKVIRQELKSQVPIIVVTANTSTADLEKTYELGVNNHVYKPINAEYIKKALIEAVKG